MDLTLLVPAFRDPDPASTTITFAPSRSRSSPSITTLSPAAKPELTVVRRPSPGPMTTSRLETVESVLTT